MRKQIFLFYCYVFFKSADVKRGLFVLYWLHVGLSNFQAGTLQTILFWSNLLTEIPTGFLADRLSRRANLILGCGFRIINALGYLYFKQYEMFVFLSIMSGISLSFFSGTDQAYLYETLKAHSAEDSYAVVQSRAKAIEAASLAIAMSLGGFLQAISWMTVFIVFLGVMLTAALFASLLERHEREIPKNSDGVEISHMQSLRQFFATDNGRRLMLLIIGLAIFDAAYTPYFIFGQALFSSLKFAPVSIANILAFTEFGTALSYLYTGRLVSRLRPKVIYAATFVVLAISLISTTLQIGWLTIAAFSIGMILPTAMSISFETFFQSQVTSSIRATFFSISSLVSSAFMSFSFMTVGYYMDSHAPSAVIAVLATLPVFGLFLGLRYFKVTSTVTTQLEKAAA